MTQDDSDYFRTDEFDDVHFNCIMILHMLDQVVERDFWWKFLTIAFHNAIQGACVCILTDTSGLGALRKDSTKSLLRKFDELDNDEIDWPEERLAPLSQLLNRLPDDIKCSLNQGTSEFDEKLRWLQFDRDQFMHFSPSHLSASKKRMIASSLRAAELIGEIVNHSEFRRRQRLNLTNINKEIGLIVERLTQMQSDIQRAEASD